MTQRRRAIALEILGIIFIAFVFVVMYRLTAGSWNDPFVDFGRELYVPWQILEGRVLYRDIAYLNGPVSPYINAAVFALLGTGLDHIIAANLVVLMLVVALTYLVTRVTSGRTSAVICCTFVGLVFAFGQMLPLGNYNFMTPYSHELTHGLLIAMIALTAAWRWCVTGRAGWIAVCGLAIGSSFLTKPEIFLGTAVSATTMLVTAGRTRLQAVSWRQALVFLLTVVVPSAWAIGALGLAMPVRDALNGILTAYRGALDPAISGMPFYKMVSGFDSPWSNLGHALLIFVVYVLGLVGLLVVSRVERPASRWRRFALCGTAALATAFLFVAIWYRVPWSDLARPLPLALVGLIAVRLRVLVREQPSPSRVLSLGLAVLGVMLLAKMLLFASLYHYGFVLAFPGAVAVISAIVGDVPRALDSQGRFGALFRTCAVVVVLAVAVGHVQRTLGFVRQKTTIVGHAPDQFRAEQVGTALSEIVAYLDRNRDEMHSVAVLPEGVMINYLSRIPSSTRFIGYLPVEMAVFGESSMLAAMTQSPPDAVVLVTADTTDYGVRPICVGYGVQLCGWVLSNYEPVALIGDDPREAKGWGALVLKHRTTDPAPGDAGAEHESPAK